MLKLPFSSKISSISPNYITTNSLSISNPLKLMCSLSLGCTLIQECALAWDMKLKTWTSIFKWHSSSTTATSKYWPRYATFQIGRVLQLYGWMTVHSATTWQYLSMKSHPYLMTSQITSMVGVCTILQDVIGLSMECLH